MDLQEIKNYEKLIRTDLETMTTDHTADWSAFDGHLAELKSYISGGAVNDAILTELAMFSADISYQVNDLAQKTNRHPNRSHPYEGEKSSDPAEFEFAVYRNAHKRLLEMLDAVGIYDNTDNPKFRHFFSSGYRGAEILDLEDEGMDSDTDLDKTLLAFLIELANKIAHRDDDNLNREQQRNRAMDEDDIRWNIARYCSEGEERLQSLRQLLDHIRDKYPHIWEELKLVVDDMFRDQKKIMDKYLRKVIEGSGNRIGAGGISLNKMREALEASYKETLDNIYGTQVASFKLQDGEIVSSGSRKVYPNDPCPCGSGLKYKKCCGKVSRT